MAFISVSLQILWQKFYTNIPWVVLYQICEFCPNCWIWLVAMAIERLNLRKNIEKLSRQKPLRGWGWDFVEMFITLASTKFCFLLPLLTCFHCCDNLSFRRLTMENIKVGLYFYLTADILTKVLQKCSLSSPLPNIWILSKPLNLIVAMATEKLILRTNFQKSSP